MENKFRVEAVISSLTNNDLAIAVKDMIEESETGILSAKSLVRVYADIPPFGNVGTPMRLRIIKDAILSEVANRWLYSL